MVQNNPSFYLVFYNIFIERFEKMSKSNLRTDKDQSYICHAFKTVQTLRNL